MLPQQNVIPGPFGYQFIPEHVSTVPAPPSASPTPSIHKLLGREELNTVDDFIDNPEMNGTYNEADLGAMAEALPPALLGWTSTMPINDTYTPQNSSMYNGALDTNPSYHHQWQPQNHHPIHYQHSIYSNYLPTEQGSGSIGLNQSVNPQIAFPPTAVSSTDRELNSGFVQFNPMDTGAFGAADYYAGSRMIDYFAPEALSSAPPMGPVGNFTGPFNIAQNYQYGNDIRFEPNGYVALSDRGPAAESEPNEMGILKCLERTDSNAVTPSLSPVMKRPSQHSSVQLQDLQSPQMLPDALYHPLKSRGEQNSPSSGSQKRQRDVTKDEGSLQDERNSPNSGSKKRQRDVTDNEDDLQGDNSPEPRRKNRKKGARTRSPKIPIDSESPESARPLPKKPRMRGNLSNDQKKANHTKAEQDRRNSIKENLTELIKLVPGLQGQNLNKCQNITRIGEWLDGMLEDNEKITVKLKESMGEEAFQKALKGASENSYGY